MQAKRAAQQYYSIRRAAASDCVAAFRDQDPCPGPQCVPLENQEPRETRVMEHDDLLQIEDIATVAALLQTADMPEVEAEAEV